MTSTCGARLICSLAVVLGLVGCDSDDGGGSCGNVAACGGDIVGDWTITESCFSLTGAAPTGDFCPTATADAGGLKVTGTVSYRADMTYAAMVTSSGSFALVLPSSCLTMEGITLTCSQLSQGLQQAMAADPDPAIQSASCTGSGSCRCTFVMAPQDSSSSGTYSTSGHTVTDESGASDYCVKGSKLYFSEMDMGAEGLGASGTIVLEK